MQTIKENPWKVMLGSSGTIITLVGALFSIDARYAHAADVEKDKVQTQILIKQSSQTLRQQMLEDKLFELDAKQAEGKLTPVETAMRDRYKRQLQEITRDQK